MINIKKLTALLVLAAVVFTLPCFEKLNAANTDTPASTRLSSAEKQLMYTSKKTKVYKSASTGSAAVATLTADYPVYVTGKSGNFYIVSDYHSEFTGYVQTGYLSQEKVNKYAIADSAKISYSSAGSSTVMPSTIKSTQSYLSDKMTAAQYRDHMVYIAQCKLGCKYSTTPDNTLNFNNLGFVRACYNAMSITIPTTVRGVAHTGKGEYVARRDLLKGDIVCFDCDENDSEIVDHIGIYVGKGYFIHASYTAGCIVVSNMSSGYYYRQFCWGRRFSN
ncbi:MAG: C40 family peptidase [Clostridia bacterium]|nr:C40 family peptidase [Clostridia bacterium]